MPETNFIETEALLIAIRDVETDSGVYEVDEYLEREFLPGELRKLSLAAEVLSDRADRAYRAKKAEEAGA